MLTLPAAWDRHYGSNVITVMPPSLPARIRYFERLDSSLGLQQIVERVLADDPEFRVHELGPVERIVTAEGEYGALICVRGMQSTSRAQRWIASVFAGEVTTALDVLAWGRFGEVEQVARELMIGQRLELGSRPRQFFYISPRGWHGLPMGAVANWYPLDFPSHRAVIVVPPATAEHALGAILEACASGLVVDERTSEGFRSEFGLDGTYLRLRGRRDGHSATYHREVIGFAAGSRVYYLRLETIASTRLEDDRALFQDVARSVQPLPTATATESARLDLFDHWTG